MAKQKQNIKFFDCNTCNEQSYFQGVAYCSAKNKSEDMPSEYSLCENVKECVWWRAKQ